MTFDLAPDRFSSLLRFLLLFVACYVAQEACYLMVPDAVVSGLYHYVMLVPIRTLLNLFDGSDGLHVAANVLVSNHVALSVVRGCDASGVLFLLIAAIAATQVTPWGKWVGVLWAIVLVYLLNELRLATLYVVVRSRPAWFSAVHVYIWPLALIALTTWFFLSWSQRMALETARGTP